MFVGFYLGNEQTWEYSCGALWIFLKNCLRKPLLSMGYPVFWVLHKFAIFKLFSWTKYKMNSIIIINFNEMKVVKLGSRPTLDVSQVLSNSISISDTGGLDLSRHYNCNCCITSCASCITFCAIHHETFLSGIKLKSLYVWTH